MTKRLAIVLIAVVVSHALVFARGRESKTIELASPNGRVSAKVFVNDNGRLAYNLTRGETVILNDSPMGITIDGADLGKAVTLGRPKHHTVNERYPWRGVKSEAVNHYNGVTLPITHNASGLTWTLRIRIYDDGFAYRYVVPGKGRRTVSGEKTAWRLPAGSKIWYQTVTRHYEGIHTKQKPEEIKKDTYIGFPITLELPDGSYAAITEAALFDYSGMTLQSTNSALLQGTFEDDPNGWQLQGTICSPWRVTMTGPDLNALVNCDIVHNLCPAYDKKLFPKGLQTDWIKPGRSLWHWWSGVLGNFDSVAFELQTGWVDKTAELGFEYYLVDAGWEDTWKTPDKDKWAHLKELVDYADRKNVGIFIWKRWAGGITERIKMTGIETRKERLDFFKRCSEAGAAGVKIDFMDSESKQIIDFYTDTLKDAADFKLMINFHGANKPTGEARTWPNEMTREGVMGLEYNKWSNLPPHHYASLPFTRCLAGHADFTPCTFNPDKLKGTTFTLQLATAIVYTSPLLHWADKPDLYLESPAAEIIKQIPSVWDETRVLPGSKIGELAAFARRKNNTWFVGIINAGRKRQYNLDLSFLDRGSYNAIFVRDKMDSPADMTVEKDTVNSSQKLTIEMREGGGFVACLFKRKNVKK